MARLNRFALVVSTMCAAVLMSADLTAGSSEVTVATGVEFTSGDYGGSEDVEETYVPLLLGYQTSNYKLALTVPYLSVDAPAGTAIGEPGGGVVVGSGDTTTESGVGDVILGGALYDVWTSSQRDFSMDLAGEVKFGTADADKGLGTGEDDYTIYANFYRWFDKATLLASVGYRFRGDPAGVDLNDTGIFSLGGSYRFTDTTSGGVIFDYREAALEDADDPSEVTGYVSHRINQSWRIKAFYYAGLSDSSPDWGSGLMIEWRAPQPEG